MTPIVEDDSRRALTVGESAANPYGITVTRPGLRHPAAPMTRIARIVLPGALHHVTQRGNRRGRIFFGDDDPLSRLARRILPQVRRRGLGLFPDARSRPLSSSRRPTPRDSGWPCPAPTAATPASSSAGAPDGPSVSEALRLGSDGRGPSDRGRALPRAQSGSRPPGRAGPGLAPFQRPRAFAGRGRRADQGGPRSRPRRLLRRPPQSRDRVIEGAVHDDKAHEEQNMYIRRNWGYD